MRFDKKVIIVTGGGTGIGRAVAELFVAEGAKAVLVGRREKILQEAARALDPSGKSVAVLAADISDPATGVRAVELATSRFGGVDVLSNNAGFFAPKPFLEATLDEYDRFVDVILKGKFFMAQAAARAMITRGGGAIVNTGSLWALQAVIATPSAAYSAANGGVHQLTRNLAIELAQHKIRVNAVAPAVVETLAYGTFMTPEQVAETLPRFAAFHPLGRIGQPHDVATAIAFLASDDAAWMTGVVMPVDGGVMAGR